MTKMYQTGDDSIFARGRRQRDVTAKCAHAMLLNKQIIRGTFIASCERCSNYTKWPVSYGNQLFDNRFRKIILRNNKYGGVMSSFNQRIMACCLLMGHPLWHWHVHIIYKQKKVGRVWRVAGYEPLPQTWPTHIANHVCDSDHSDFFIYIFYIVIVFFTHMN